MSVRKDNSPGIASRLPAREGHNPPDLFRFMPLVAILGLVCLIFSISLPDGPLHTAAHIGIGVGFLIVALIHGSRLSRWERKTHKARLMTMEALIDLLTAMGTDQGTEVNTLKRVPDAVRALLTMETSVVGLLEENGTVLRILASSGVEPPLDGQCFSLADLPLVQQCIDEKYVAVVSDTRDKSGRLNSSLARELNCRSMVAIPIVYQDQVMGVMGLGHSQPRVLAQLDARRAWLWGSMAGVLISHGRLYKQMIQTVTDQKKLMEHRNALFEMHTSIQRPGTLNDILQRIVELAPGTLDVDAAMVWLLADDDPQMLSMAAATIPYGSAVAGFRLPISASWAGIVFNSGKSVIVENGPSDPQLNPDLSKRLPHGSLMLEPLMRGDGRCMGVIVLMRRQVGAFRPDQLEMARMLSVRAAAILEMARLHEQTVSDAEAKAMLLRELNHRVKNNLAGIISLLSIHQPPLSRDARRWIDRAIGRIEAMAQVHDLFSIGARRVTLAELVERTVRSMSVVKPAGVKIKTELAAGRALLRTDRAVSLAMAMHELCFNGLVHGLRDHGTLTIRARRDNGHLAVEVEDDAGRPAVMPIEPPAGTASHGPGESSHSGIGLSLVRGLVGRELRGQFTLAPSDGGMRATVLFPLLADELSDGAL